MANDLININGIKIDDSILKMLSPELEQGLHICDNLLNNQNKESPQKLPVDKEKTNLLSYFHRLKGSTGFIGFTDIEELARKLEISLREDDINYIELIKQLRLEIINLLTEIKLANKES